MIYIEDLMRNTTTTSSSPHGDDHHPLLLLLPDVYFLIQEILVCLPVKSLLRFKSVCKSWRQLIQTPFFIDLHTTTTTTTSKFGDTTTFILQTIEPSREKYEDDIKLYMLSSSESGSDGDHGDGEDDDNKDEDDQKRMVFKVDEDLGFLPFYKDYLLEDSLRMVGSCNGIICLHDPKVTEHERGFRRQLYSNLRDVSLWNPATRHFRILPKSIPIQEKININICCFEDFIGFGFDVKTKDCKVLRITPFIPLSYTGGGCMCRVQVYSLSTDSWRLLEDINSLPALPNQDLSLNNSGIYLNGSYFFMATKSYTGICSFMLLSFDFTKEIFTTMQLPDDNLSGVLSYLGDKMAVFTRSRIDSDGGYWYYDIWVLNEQHSSGSVIVYKESWTKLHSIKNQRNQPYSERCISNNGDFALISAWGNNMLQLFNLVTKEAKNDFTIGSRGTNVCGADVYKESLVSIMGGGNVLLRWQLPSHGTTYKLNLDAPFIDYGRPFGIGLCLTSNTGGCIGIRSLHGYVRDAIEGEAMAMLEAIKWVKMWELSPIIIESYSKNVVSFFMEDDDDDDDNNSTYWSSGALSLLKEAKVLLLNSSKLVISFQYCSRSCNYVADVAAKLGREGDWCCMDWTANSPGEMVRSLGKDLGRKT